MSRNGPDRGADELMRLAEPVFAEHALLDEVAGDRRAGREPRGHRRVEERRRDRVHTHAADPLERERARELYDGPLRREIGARVRVGDEAADRGDVDYAAPPLLQHPPAEALTRQERALQVEGDDRVEPVLGELLGGGAEGGAGAVDEHVDAAEPGDHVGDGEVDCRRVGDVGGERGGRAARVPDRGAHLAGALRVDVHDRDRRARLREAAGDRCAEPARAASDDRDAALEAEEACDKSVGERCRRHAAVIAFTAATRSSTVGSTSRSSAVAYGIGVSFAVTRAGVARNASMPTASTIRATTSDA